MTKSLPDIAKSEWVLMEALWSRARGTATELQTDLKSSQGWAYSTVKTMLDRLVDKGYVKSRRVGNVYEYKPKYNRKAVVFRVLDDVVERVLEGSVTPFIHRLVEQQKLTKSDVDELRAMLDQYGEEDEELDE